MKINTLNNQREEQEINDTAIKMKLEKTFSKDIKRFLDELTNDFAVVYAKTGNIIELDVYDAELIGLLKNNYKKIEKKFKRNLRNQIKQSKQQTEDNKVDETIEAALLLWLLMQAKKQSLYILNTSEKIIQNTVNSVIIEAARQGIQLRKNEVAKKAKEDLKKKSQGRADIIATTETQQVAEKTKFIEASEIDKTALVLVPIKKQWRAVLDERTRISHGEADGQIKFLNEPFSVKGQQLMHPGDTSLGASIDNVVNCRCVSVPIIGV